MENRYNITIANMSKAKLITLSLLLFVSPQAWSLSTGIVGHSGDPLVNGGNTCSLCHSGGVAPTAQLAGPASVEAGSQNTFTLTMSGGVENLAGFNVSASQGSLNSSEFGVGVESGELKHTQASSVGNAGGNWSFSFIAPTVTGNVTLYAAVVSANGDSQMTGDGVGTATLSVEVTPAQVLLPPTADPGGPFFALPDEVIQFDAGNSTDGDGTVDRFLWDFGDSSAFGQGQAISHAYPNEGTYTVTLAATDNDGLTGAAATTVTVSANAGAAQGEALFAQHCSSCHTFASVLAGRTVNQVNTAIATVPEMQFLTLTPEEIQLIVDFLATGGGEPPPRPTDGPGLYGAFCGLCHGADGRGGSAIAVTGAPLQMISEGIANIVEMQSIDLTLEEQQLVADFLIAGGSGAIPADGPGLYDVFCSVCHGANGGGGKFFAVTGASSPMITDAIANEAWMQSLPLDATQVDAIAIYLSAGGGATLPTDGEGLYTVFCGVCHGAGGLGGNFIGVTGASNEMISDAIANETWMNQLQMTSPQIQEIANYLGRGGALPLPTSDSGLYDRFCLLCHGIGGLGDRVYGVTGASNEMIEEAIVDQPWMDSLVLSSSQAQQIADYLGRGGEPPLPSSGSGLYGRFCEVCHGAGGHGGKFKAVTGSAAAMINSAINNEPWMDSLVLNSTQVNAIAGYLGTGGGGTLPTDGAGLYGVFCSVCHGADGRGDTYKVVTGTSVSFINRAVNSVGLMTHLQLNSSQVQAIDTFLASGGGGSKPATGSGLYYVYCQTCHGANGNGGPEEGVRGSSASNIRSEVSGVSNMRQLQPYLTNSDYNAIANFLGGSSNL
jgi:mono/diheme cytochrome c family protein